jgi:hypothetical protein
MRHDWEGEIHTLTVHAILPPEEVIGEEDLDYDIEHPSSCKRMEETTSDGHGVVWWDCEVDPSVVDGLAESLRYSGTPVTEPGTYKIRGWGAKYWTECGDEYDGGVVIAEDTDEAAT